MEGWRLLLEGWPWFSGEDSFPLKAYSEFMPAPWMARPPYGELDPLLFSEDDPFGWRITELEEEYEFNPGLEQIAYHLISQIVSFTAKAVDHPIGGRKGLDLKDNPYWTPELEKKAGKLKHERFVILAPIALSRTQDDKGRIRWTLFGSSEQGPERAFWKGFYSGPGCEIPESSCMPFFYGLFSKAYSEQIGTPGELYQAGFRILPSPVNPRFPFWNSCPLPSWTDKFVIDLDADFNAIRYLLTFTPFSMLPEKAKQAYFAGRLALIPFPGSLALWGPPTYLHLQEKLPMALQIPLQRLMLRHGGPAGLRIPQAGWFREYRPGIDIAKINSKFLRDTYVRTSRHDKIQRYENEIVSNKKADRITKALFSTALVSMGLYDKPLAKNCQLWTKEHDLLLDGPNATEIDIEKARAQVLSGGIFGYRMQFPPMRIGLHEVYWHRALAAFYCRGKGGAVMLDNAPAGYFTCYRADSPDLANPVELYPRLLRRELCLQALRGVKSEKDHYQHQTSLNLAMLLDLWQLSGRKSLPRDFVHATLRISKRTTLKKWLSSLPVRTVDSNLGKRIWESIEESLEKPVKGNSLPAPITFGMTGGRDFEEFWWKDIADLSDGRFVTTDNADCVQDRKTLKRLPYNKRDLERVGDFLMKRHEKAINEAGMAGKALAGEIPFTWSTDFDFQDFGGWRKNRDGSGYERNILVVIPGKNRGEAVVMADHYDTAYMEDIYEKSLGGSGARLASRGADDNHSATATLLQAAPIFLKLSKDGLLERDIWLLHLTGEEFPSDCMGARDFCRNLVQNTLSMKSLEGESIDLSGVKVKGVCLMDMIAHNIEKAKDIFQISPGRSRESLLLAYEAHTANMMWNEHARKRNHSRERCGLSRGRRSEDGAKIPDIALYPHLRGEVRTWDDPQSSLYNTDGQIFSDMGVPVILFMENYDLTRTGYHDTKDTMENIDLDYGSALAAIAIETVARLACK